MAKTTRLAVLSALALATFAGRAEKLPPLPDGAFTYVVIPDTQLYRGEGAHVKKGKKPQPGPTRNPAFASRVDWIAANIEKEKIAFVSHVGDIVDFRNAAQWAFASDQMAKLDGKVPYGISPGNHDIGGSDTSEFNTWFPRARYETNAWYAGSFGGYVNAKGKKVCAGNADSCQCSRGSTRCLINTPTAPPSSARTCTSATPPRSWTRSAARRRSVRTRGSA